MEHTTKQLEWNPPKYKCLQCNTIIWSKRPGDWVQCACKAIYVDSTRHYTRRGGDPANFIEVTND